MELLGNCCEIAVRLLRNCCGIAMGSLVFLWHCFQSAVGMVWSFPFIAVGLLCCCDIAAEFLGIFVVLLWACCRLAAAWRCIVVDLL